MTLFFGLWGDRKVAIVKSFIFILILIKYKYENS